MKKPDILIEIENIIEDLKENTQQHGSIEQLSLIHKYGAKGDGVTDDTLAIQSYINDIGNAGGGTVWIPPGKVFKHIGLIIDKPNIKLTGNGTLLDGTLTIGYTSTSNNIYVDIDNITISFTDFSDNNIGISLKNCKKVKIRNNRFNNCGKSIYVQPIDTHQHVSRVMITGNVFDTTNYCVYFDRIVGYTTPFPTGDVHFTNNQCYYVKKTHIYGTGVDGIVCTGNTMFFLGWSTQDQLKEYNIYLEDNDWAIIQGNNLFEAGYEAIYLKRARDFNITGNNIAWCGQRDLRSGICISGKTHLNDSFNNGVISANNIVYPSKYGIELTDNCGGINVIGNTIRYIGNPLTYYGTTAINSITHVGVFVSATVTNTNVIGNNSPNNENVYNSATYFGNSENGKVLKMNRVLTLSGTETTFDATNFEQINLSQSALTNITNITTTVNSYKNIKLVGLNSNTTIVYNASYFKLKGSVDVNIPLGGILILEYIAGKWWEVSRSF